MNSCDVSLNKFIALTGHGFPCGAHGPQCSIDAQDDNIYLDQAGSVPLHAPTVGNIRAYHCSQPPVASPSGENRLRQSAYYQPLVPTNALMVQCLSRTSRNHSAR